MPKKKNPDLGLGEPISFYNGEVTLRFSERDHIYYLVREDGTLEPQDGVTHTCGIIDKSNYLIPWGCKMMAEKLLRTAPISVDGFGQYLSISWPEFEELVTAAKSAHKEKLVDAGDVGTAAHKWLEDSIRWAIAFNAGYVVKLTDKRPTDERAINCGNTALEWMKVHKVQFLKTEHKIYSRKWKYAGTMDGLAFVDGQKCVVDWKTSNYLHDYYLLQTAAYQNAENEEFYDRNTVDDKPISARWILRLGKEEGDFEPWYTTDLATDFQAFLHCLLLKRSLAEIKLGISNAKKERAQLKKQAKKEANANKND